MVPHSLVLPPKDKKLHTNYHGMLELEAKKGAKFVWMHSAYEVYIEEPKGFADLFKEFCLNSILVS